MAKIKIDLEMLLVAMEDHIGYSQWYLDKQTGEVRQISDDFADET